MVAGDTLSSCLARCLSVYVVDSSAVLPAAACARPFLMRQRRRHRTSSCSADTKSDEDVLGKEDVDEIVEVESEAVM